MKKLNKIFIMVLFVSAVAICFSGCVTFGPAFTPFFTTLARAYRSKEVYEGNKYMYAKFASASDCSGDYYVMTIMYCEDSDIVTIDDERWGKYENTIIKLNVVLNDNDHEWEFVNKNKNDTPKIIIRFTEEFECDLYLNDETMTNSIRLRYIPTAEEIEEKERVYGKKYTDYPEE